MYTLAISFSYRGCKLKLVRGALGRTSLAPRHFLLCICGGDIECVYLATPPPPPPKAGKRCSHK